MLRNTFRVFVVLSIATVTACLIFPTLWPVISSLFDEDYGPARVFRRVWMISVVLGLILGGRYIGVQHPGRVGFSFRKGSLKNLLVGVAVSQIFLFCLAFFYVAIGAWYILESIDIAYLLQKLAEGFLRGTVVAGLEEYIFRGLIFLSLARFWGWIYAGAFSSILFASLHFVTGEIDPNMLDVNAWYSGFVVCGNLLKGMAETFVLFPDACGLFIVGMIMCYATIKTGTLWYAAGLHGSWIWFFSFRQAIFEYTLEYDLMITGGGRLYDGVIPMIGMLVIFPISYLLAQKNILHFEEDILRKRELK